MIAHIRKARVTRTPRVSLRWCAELLWNLAAQRINLRYKETLLGFGWIFLQPVALTLIFNYIRRVAHIPTGDVPYSLFVAVGLVPWSFTSLAVSQSSGVITGNQAILKRVSIPKILLPLSVVISTMADLAVMALLLVGLFLYYGFAIQPTLAWLLMIFSVHLCLLGGIACLISLSSVYLRDMGQAIPHLLWLWFFSSPVFYPLSMVPKEFQAIAKWNPVTGLIESYRAVLLNGNPPPWDLFLPSVAVSFGLLAVGLLVFKAVEGILVDML